MKLLIRTLIALFLVNNSSAVEDKSVAAFRMDSIPEWKQFSAGNNLIYGLPAWFSVEPNWGGASANNPHRLSDGKLSSSVHSGDYEAGDASRWGWSEKEVVILYDLQTPRSVQRVLVRFLGGLTLSPRVAFPREIEVLGSHDRKTFYRLGRLQKLLAAEKDTANWTSSYYLPENDEGYPYAFVMETPVDQVRYIGLKIRRDGHMLISDEIAVIESSEQPGVALEEYPQVELVLDTAAAFFRDDHLWITENIVTPNWFHIDDARTDIQSKIELRLDLPDTVEVLGWEGYIPEKEVLENGLVRYSLPVNTIRRGTVRSTQGPLYLRFHENHQETPEAQAKLLTLIDGEITREQVTTIRSLTIPDASDWQDWSKFSISLGWMWDEWTMTWPDFFKAYSTLGFNQVPTFPRYLDNNPERNVGVRFTREDKLEFFNRVREHGLGIVYNESPFHVLQARKSKSHPEILNVVDGKPGRYLSPIYRGSEYQGEMERIADLFEAMRPDHIFWDIELWHTSLAEANRDPAFHKAIEESGLSREEFVKRLGVETLRDLKEAVQRKSEQHNIPMPTIGLYTNQPARPVYMEIYAWNQIYPEYIDLAMPSLYVQGNILRVHQVIRENASLLGNRDLIPWLTAGTYGKYDPARLEFMIYETLINGAGGFTYYIYDDFDPRHFYSQAKALSTLSPYRHILLEGTHVHDFTGNHDALCYSMVATTAEGLILIGNYESNQPVAAQIQLPPNTHSVVDLRSGKEYPVHSSQWDVEVPGMEATLLYFQTRQETE